MIYDITLEIPKEHLADNNTTLLGHIGTHFDVMNKEFPLSYFKRKDIVFDVEGIDEISIDNIDVNKIEKDMFVIFHSHRIDNYSYFSKDYSTNHPMLSYELIDLLIKKKISLIGVDFQGVRRHKEHTPADQYLADNGIFVIENLCNLKDLHLKNNLVAYTAPVNFIGLSGLPCRVILEEE